MEGYALLTQRKMIKLVCSQIRLEATTTFLFLFLSKTNKRNNKVPSWLSSQSQSQVTRSDIIQSSTLFYYRPKEQVDLKSVQVPHSQAQLPVANYRELGKKSGARLLDARDQHLNLYIHWVS